jgi:hypothetical protein
MLMPTCLSVRSLDVRSQGGKNKSLLDGTLPIINKLKHLKKKGNTRNKMEGPTSKKTKEPPKRVNHKGNLKFPNPLFCHEKHIKQEKRRTS